ncbi:Nephrocystin-3 [Trichoplax sp. H2]|nr:Nephrocystin-3 [Trichoplax sp. H2]|eukprot:RDD37541.1 Nephrocystin-3 [Trichoplax sp. H2]
MGNDINKFDKIGSENLDPLYQFADHKYKGGDLRMAKYYYKLIVEQIRAKNSIKNGSEELLTKTYYSLSKIYLQEKKLSVAEKYNRKAEAYALKLEDQARVAEILDMRSDIRRLEGKYIQAIDDLKKSLSLKFQLVGTNDRSTSYSYHKLGKVYYSQSKYEVALSFYRKALDTRKNSLEENNVELYQDMGFAYSRLSRFNDAEEVYKEALNIKLTLPAYNDTSIANSYWCLAVIYYRQSKYEIALTMNRTVLELRIKSLGESHPSVAKSYYHLGLTYSKLSKYNEALDMHKNALHLRLHIGKENQVDVALSYEKLGVNYDHLCRYSDAISAFEKGLNILQKLYGNQHIKVATSYNSLGIVYCRLGQYGKAQDMYHKAMHILINLGGGNYAQIATICNNMGKIFNGQHKQDCYFHFNDTNSILLESHKSNVVDQRPKSYPIEIKSKSYESTVEYCTMESEFHEDEESSFDTYKKMQGVSSVGSLDPDTGEHRGIHIQEKDYFQAYVKALREGECRSSFIRIMIFGPPNVGKSSIMKVFTEQGLIHHASRTKIAENTNKMVNQIFYNICDKTVCNYRNILDKKILDTVEKIDQQNLMTNHDGYFKDSQVFDHLPSWSSSNEEMESPIAINKMQHHLGLKSSVTDSKQPLEEMLHLNSQCNPLDKSIDSLEESGFHSQSTDSSPMANNFLQIYKEFYQRRLQIADLADTEDCQYGKLWDFGGHSIYHVTYQPFMSANSIYILVFNITQDINDKIVKRDGLISDMTYLQAVQEWLTSIIGINSSREKIQVKIDQQTEEYSLPVVILVASHADEIEREGQRIRTFKRFEQALISNLPEYRCNIYSSQIIFNCNPKDNCQSIVKQRQECCRRLHHIINKLVTSISFMCNAVPIRWYVMAKILHLIANKQLEQEASSASSNGLQKGRKIVKEEEVRQLARDYGLYKNHEDLHSMLQYLHDLGEIVHCPIGIDDGIVVLEVDWLLNIFRETIHLGTCLSRNAGVTYDYQQAPITGKISKRYIDYKLQGFNLDEHDKKLVLKLMEKYDIICPIQFDDRQNSLHQYYFVPYLLQPEVEYFDLARYTLSDWLYIGYEHNDVPYIPDSIYYCLLSSCLKEWNNSQLELHHQCAKYYLEGSYYYIIIKKENSHIGLQYCYQKEHNHKDLGVIMETVKQSICYERPQDLIRRKLKAIVKQRLPRFKRADCRFYVKCTECQQITGLEQSKRLSNPSLVHCIPCKLQFHTSSIDDWMIYRQENLLGREKSNEDRYIHHRHDGLPLNNPKLLPDDSGKYFIDIDPSFDPRRYFPVIARSIGTDWPKLAAELDPYVDIDRIKSENVLVWDQAFKYLQSWYKNCYQNASIKLLKKALRNIKRNDIVNSVGHDCQLGSKILCPLLVPFDLRLFHKS